jgi:RecA-family ATPase
MKNGSINARLLNEDIRSYASIMYDPDDIVWYSQKAEQREEKWIPMGNGNCCKASELHTKVTKTESPHGVWVRINPSDGKGVFDVNVVDYRYVLVESDTLSIEKQVAVYQQLELPIKALVHSGGKSAHAIVCVDAGTNYDLYQARVEYLYEVLTANGMDVDRQNRNPARLSRLPGVMRGDSAQYLMGSDLGKSTWEEWHHYIELMNDNMPPLEEFTEISRNVPEKAEPIIEDLVRRGHKMSISSASKAGKSFLVAGLGLSLAEGSKWMGMQCKKSKVLLCNFEVSRESFDNRLVDVAEAKGHSPDKDQLHVWNLRGKAVGLRSFVPVLLRKIRDMDFDVIILDPSYKILEGDENSAKDVTEFVNLFDIITEESGCTLITIGHYSKGKQGAKAAQDRQSGSGVLARDPDAIVTLTPLEGYNTVFRMEFDLREFPPRLPVDVITEVIGNVGRTIMTHKLTRDYRNVPLAGGITSTKKNNEACKILLDRIIEMMELQGGMVLISNVAEQTGLPCEMVVDMMEYYNSTFKVEGARVVRK